MDVGWVRPRRRLALALQLADALTGVRKMACPIQPIPDVNFMDRKVAGRPSSAPNPFENPGSEAFLCYPPSHSWPKYLPTYVQLVVPAVEMAHECWKGIYVASALATCSLCSFASCTTPSAPADNPFGADPYIYQAIGSNCVGWSYRTSLEEG